MARDALRHPDVGTAFAQRLVRPRCAALLVVAGARIVDGVVEPERRFDLGADGVVE
ncbi:MAG: hypothetical protein U0235_02195 [Polyangiaceae bacterium]